MADALYHQLTARYDAKTEARLGHLFADFHFFVSEENIPFQFIKLLDPPENCLWELCSLAPPPGLRVLGCFAARDVFVATAMAERRDLGARGSRQWRQFERTASMRFNAIMNPFPPLNCSRVEDAVSGVHDDAYFRKD